MSSFWENVLSGGISGIVGGAIVGIVLYVLQKRIEENDRVNVNLAKLKKRLPPDVLQYIRPGTNVKKVKESLGEPDYHTDYVWSMFSDPSDPISTKSYVFKFLNANLCITSKDDISVDTVSIFSAGNERKKHWIKFPFPVNEGIDGFLGETKVTSSLLDYVQNHNFNRTAREMSWGIETYAGWASGYLSYSYFGYHLNGFESYEHRPNTQYFIGAQIDGVCISNKQSFAVAIGEYT